MVAIRIVKNDEGAAGSKQVHRMGDVTVGNSRIGGDKVREGVDGEDQIKTAARKRGESGAVAHREFSVGETNAAPPRLFDHTRRHIDPGYRAQTWCERDFEAADAAADIERGQVRLQELPFVETRHNLA